MYLENSLVDGKQRSEELFQLEDGLLFFTGGRGSGGLENFSHANIFYMQLVLQTIFVPSFSCKQLFFACIQFISVFTTSANNLFQKFPNPPPPRSKK